MIEVAPLLARYEEYMKKHGFTRLYFPNHVNRNHWIAGHIDLEQNLIGIERYHFVRHHYTEYDSGGHIWRGDLGAGARSSRTGEPFHSPYAQSCDPYHENHLPSEIRSGRKIPENVSAEISVAVVLGDYNFPDLAEFIMANMQNGDAASVSSLPTKSQATLAGNKAPFSSDINARKKKRAREDLDESVDIDMVKPKKRIKRANGTGTSKSSVAAKKIWDAIRSGELTMQTAEPVKLER
ncbi:hypothetical protein B0H11DRAFT_1928091 [Mycena galericulata]|nr:hypothetical protein B0H11DRAFT_1928091 [Mycena galericulata]